MVLRSYDLFGRQSSFSKGKGKAVSEPEESNATGRSSDDCPISKGKGKEVPEPEESTATGRSSDDCPIFSGPYGGACNDDSTNSIILHHPGSDVDTRLKFTTPDHSYQYYELPASNFKLEYDVFGAIYLNVHRGTRRVPSCEPRIRIPRECLNGQYSGRFPLRRTAALISYLELVLPSTHECLQDFELMSDKLWFQAQEGMDGRKRPAFRGNWQRCNGETPGELDLFKFILMHPWRGQVHITKLVGKEWVPDEKYTSLYNQARDSHPQFRRLDPERQPFRNFCKGIGPSDWSVYARKQFDKEIEKGRETCINTKDRSENAPFVYEMPLCWRFLYAGEDGGIKVEDVEEKGKGRSIRSWVTNGKKRLKRSRGVSALGGGKENVKLAKIEKMKTQVGTLHLGPKDESCQITSLPRVDSAFEEGEKKKKKEKGERKGKESEGKEVHVGRKESLTLRGWKAVKNRVGSTHTSEEVKGKASEKQGEEKEPDEEKGGDGEEGEGSPVGRKQSLKSKGWAMVKSKMGSIKGHKSD